MCDIYVKNPETGLPVVLEINKGPKTNQLWVDGKLLTFINSADNLPSKIIGTNLTIGPITVAYSPTGIQIKNQTIFKYKASHSINSSGIMEIKDFNDEVVGQLAFDVYGSYVVITREMFEDCSHHELGIKIPVNFVYAFTHDVLLCILTEKRILVYNWVEDRVVKTYDLPMAFKFARIKGDFIELCYGSPEIYCDPAFMAEELNMGFLKKTYREDKTFFYTYYIDVD